MAGPTSRPFLKAFACAAVFFVVPIVVVLIAWGPPKNDYAYNLLGQLFALTAVPAVITGVLARRAKTAWSMVKIVLIYVFVLIILAVVTLAGKIKT